MESDSLDTHSFMSPFDRAGQAMYADDKFVFELFGDSLLSKLTEINLKLSNGPPKKLFSKEDSLNDWYSDTGMEIASIVTEFSENLNENLDLNSNLNSNLNSSENIHEFAENEFKIHSILNLISDEKFDLFLKIFSEFNRNILEIASRPDSAHCKALKIEWSVGVENQKPIIGPFTSLADDRQTRVIEKMNLILNEFKNHQKSERSVQ